MSTKIIKIRQSYDNGTLRDGVVAVIEKEDKTTVEYPISGTEWSVRCGEENFYVGGVLLMKDQIQEINHLFKTNV